MIKTELFSYDSISKIEEVVNSFLIQKSISKENLIDIKFAESSQCWSVLIIYEEK